MNRLSHFKTDINGHNIHFIHQKGNGRTSTPLLLVHGWPDSFLRFLNIIPLLTEADENGHSFNVTVPSIPGYGFSGRPDKKGMNPTHIASIFTALMTDTLGYDKFIAHGGDWGSTIVEQLGLNHEKHILGLHLTDTPSRHGMMPLEDPSPAEKKFLADVKLWVEKEGAYFKEQSTKPQTLAYALNDSPVGLAAWIVEKFYTWTDNNGQPESAVSKDLMLTNITLYWVTQTVLSSVSIYYEASQAYKDAQTPPAGINPFSKEESQSKPPAAFALFPKDIRQPPREFAERFFNVVRWNKMSKGGHFTAMEQPELLAKDIKEFAAELNAGRKQ